MAYRPYNKGSQVQILSARPKTGPDLRRRRSGPPVFRFRTLHLLVPERIHVRLVTVAWGKFRLPWIDSDQAGLRSFNASDSSAVLGRWGVGPVGYSAARAWGVTTQIPPVWHVATLRTVDPIDGLKLTACVVYARDCRSGSVCTDMLVMHVRTETSRQRTTR